MLISIIAAVLFILTILDSFAAPLYATTEVKIGLYEIKAGPVVESFLQMPWLVAVGTSMILLILALYLELFIKLKIGSLSKILAILSLLYAIPLPYIYLVEFRDLVIVFSNYAKHLAIPLFSLALIVAMSEKLLISQSRARVIADLSITEEKTERGL
ncbi:MAG: hypothetical protein QW610_03305 [Pyrobaculum sp.]